MISSQLVYAVHIMGAAVEAVTRSQASGRSMESYGLQSTLTVG